jgi:YcxB-like protein
MRETFQIKQELGFFEFLNAVTYQLSKTKMIRRFILYVFVISALSSFLGLVTTSPQGESSFLYYIKLFAPLLTAPVLFFVFTTLIVLILKIVRPNHFQNVTYYFDSWGVQKIGKGLELITAWKQFIQARESNSFIFLYVSELDAHIIQKRLFENENDLNDFREFMYYHLNNN